MALRNLRIVFLGNNELDNAKIGNFILGRDALQTEVSKKQVSERVLGKVGERLVTIINSPDLFHLDEHSDDQELTNRVDDCVGQCRPGPHAFILVVLQPENFSEEDRYKVKAILERFSENALQYTIVLTTVRSPHASAPFSNSFDLMLIDCENRHQIFDKEQVVKLLDEVDRMVEKNGGSHLNCDETEVMPETPRQPGSKRPREDDVTEDEERKKKKRNETKIVEEAQGIMKQVQHQLESHGSSSKLSDYISVSIKDWLKTPTQTTTIGLFGQIGCGKSSLLNTLLGEPDLLPTGQLEACTSVIIQVEAKSEDNNYKATIDFISKEEWHKELNGLKADLAEDRTSSIGQMARDKINALYGSDATSKGFDELVGSSYSHINDLLTEGTKCFSYSEAKDLSDEIQPYIMDDDNESGQLFWPIVKIVKIEVPKWKHLPENIVLVDLPGNGDHNQSRDNMWKTMLSKCKVVWIVSGISRAVSDKYAWEIFETNRNDMVQGGECTSIAFICTKTDDIDVTSYMRKLKDEDLQVTSDSGRERACILHRNAQAKDRIKKKADEMMQNHYTNINFSVFTVSSHELKSKKYLKKEEDTEIPLLKEELDRFNNRKVISQFVSSASGILHLIQARLMNEDKTKLSSEFSILNKKLELLRKNIQKCYDKLERKLSEGVQKAKKSMKKVLQDELSAPQGKGGAFHQTLSALCRNNGFLRINRKDTKGKTRDVNQALAQVLQDSIDEEFNRLFPNEGETGQSVLELIDEFTICSLNVDQDYKEPEVVRHILKFLKGEEAKLKEKAHTDIMETKKAMYASIRETIKQQMTPGYEEADKKSGKGSMKKKAAILVQHASSVGNQMFNLAKKEMLAKFTGLKDQIQLDFKITLEDAVRHALEESPFNIDVESEIKKMNELSMQLH